MSGPRNSISDYTPAHVRVALEEGDIDGAQRIAEDLGYSEEELRAAGLPLKDMSLTPEDTDVGC